MVLLTHVATGAKDVEDAEKNPCYIRLETRDGPCGPQHVAVCNLRVTVTRVDQVAGQQALLVDIISEEQGVETGAVLQNARKKARPVASLQIVVSTEEAAIMSCCYHPYRIYSDLGSTYSQVIRPTCWEVICVVGVAPGGVAACRVGRRKPRHVHLRPQPQVSFKKQLLFDYTVLYYACSIIMMKIYNIGISLMYGGAKSV